jgi:hypothetical protein
MAVDPVGIPNLFELSVSQHSQAGVWNIWVHNQDLGGCVVVAADREGVIAIKACVHQWRISMVESSLHLRHAGSEARVSQWE